MARYVAKNIVAAGLAEKCEIQVAYTIGKAEPVSLMMDTQGTGKMPTDELAKMIPQIFDFRPAQMIQYLDLLRPIYKKTACGGHFGRDEAEFSWERVNRVDELRKAAGI